MVLMMQIFLWAMVALCIYLYLILDNGDEI